MWSLCGVKGAACQAIEAALAEAFELGPAVLSPTF